MTRSHLSFHMRRTTRLGRALDFRTPRNVSGMRVRRPSNALYPSPLTLERPRFRRCRTLDAFVRTSYSDETYLQNLYTGFIPMIRGDDSFDDVTKLGTVGEFVSGRWQECCRNCACVTDCPRHVDPNAGRPFREISPSGHPSIAPLMCGLRAERLCAAAGNRSRETQSLV